MNGSTLQTLEAIQTLPQLSARAALLWPDEIAFRFDETGQTLSFAEVEARSDTAAVFLEEHGIGVGKTVAVMVRNLPVYPVLWLAIAKLGAVIVPMNANFRAREAGFVPSHSETELVLAAEEFVPMLNELPDNTRLEIVALDDTGSVLDCSFHTHDNRIVDVHSKSLLNIQYTSGTTGDPKGCMLDHGFFLALVRQVLIDLIELDREDVVITAQPFHYLDPLRLVTPGSHRFISERTGPVVW